MKLRTFKAYAKLNLHLDIMGSLPNGYHSLAMLMQSVDLADIITVETARGWGVEIVCDAPGIPSDRCNIACKAASAFFEGELPVGLKITIEKRIPSGAGMAGGSADAAAVLTALRDMFTPDMPDAVLCRIAARVGADVPFCLQGGSCWAEGAGERLTPVPCLPEEFRCVVVKPANSVNTAGAYAKIDAITLKRPDTSHVKRCALQGDWEGLFPRCANVFEQAIEIPGLAEAKAACRRAGASLTQMTGSGSAVFALCGRGTDINAVCEALKALGGEFCGILKPMHLGVEEIH